MSGITFAGVSKNYMLEDGSERSVIRHFDFSLDGDLFATVVGPNGCGKSTLLNLIAGIVSPSSGSVNIDTTRVDCPPRVGYVWQDYRATLLPWMTVAENIAFPLRVKGLPYGKRRTIVAEMLEKVSADLKLDQRVYELSGGKQQLVCVLRSLISEPDVLLFDEPFSALDQPTRWSMVFRIEQLWLRRRVPAVFISHDIDEAIMLADRVLLMDNRDGDVDAVLVNPLPRPRSVSMLTASEHVRCRSYIIDFLSSRGALRDMLSVETIRPA